MKKSPILPTDDAARALAHRLLRSASHAALGVIHPDTGAPFVSRIAFALAEDAHDIADFRAFVSRGCVADQPGVFIAYW